MADNIYFSLSDLLAFSSGVHDARLDTNNAYSDVSYAYEKEKERLNALVTYIEHVEVLLKDDYDTATEVKRHNETVLEALQKQLDELNYLYDQLKEAYSRAYEHYRRCCEEETRIHYETIPSTGDEATDKRLRDSHSARLNAAHKSVRAADSECYRLKQEMESVAAKIEKTKRDIETVRDLIFKLGIFIGQLQDKSQAVESYKRSLIYDLNKLNDTASRFYSVYRSSLTTLDRCYDGADVAIECGNNICECLDPDSRLNHNACVIAFTDINALSDMANRLFSVSDKFEDDSDLIKKKVRHHSNIMQDNVISSASESMGHLNDICIRKMQEVRVAGKNCKNADISLRKYHSLKYNTL